MAKMEIIKELRYLKSKGRYKQAIEKILGMIHEIGIEMGDDLKNELILLQCKLENLNLKQRRGLISYTEAEPFENKLISHSLELINEFEELLEEETPSDFKVDLISRVNNIVGTWKCVEVSPANDIEVQIIWIVKPDSEQTIFFETKTGDLGRKAEKCRYDFEDNIMEVYNANGKTEKLLIEWAGVDSIIVRVIDGEIPEYDGHKRIYQRVR